MVHISAAQSRAESRTPETTEAACILNDPSYRYRKPIPLLLSLPLSFPPSLPPSPFKVHKMGEFSSFFSFKVRVTISEAAKMDNSI